MRKENAIVIQSQKTKNAVQLVIIPWLYTRAVQWARWPLKVCTESVDPLASSVVKGSSGLAHVLQK